MVRSLYSGVAGLKSQQTKMDVIGNNIANVGTYGYKSSRATFKDVYYQTAATATASTGNTGGTNAKQIGYGNSVGSIDTNTQTSAMSSTGYNLDIAIAGEGFLQVMGMDGNIMYTKAGMLDIDSDGNLVDINGNFVLGSMDPSQPPSSNKIKVSLPFLDPSSSSVEQKVNNVGYKITSENSTDKANVSFSFVTSNSLPIGQPMAAKISGASIIVTVNARETFSDMEDFTKKLNQAITDANGGTAHPAGDFTISMDDASKFTNKWGDAIELTGSQIVSSGFEYIPGKIELPEEARKYFSIESVGSGFEVETGAAPLNDETFSVVYNRDTNGDESIKITLGDYSGTISKDQMLSSGTLLMKKTGDDNNSFTISYPSLTTMKEIKGVSGKKLSETINETGKDAEIEDFKLIESTDTSMTSSEPSRDLGLGLDSFKLSGGTEGGEQTVANLTNIAINHDGVLIGEHEIYGIVELGRVDLATFANPAGLVKVGSTYFEESLNSGEPKVVNAGTEGTGEIMASTLEASNVDLSNEFSDMIMTQRGFQASSRVITVSDTMLEELINLKR